MKTTNYRIVKTSDKYPDVLLYREFTKGESVIIYAIGVNHSMPNSAISECVTFETELMAIEFIEKFTTETAELFCKEIKLFSSQKAQDEAKNLKQK